MSVVNLSFAEREAQRLKALHQLHILDTPDEAAFDRITALAAALFEVPIALVSLIDENRQWFKSCFGEELMGTRETGRDIAFCTHAVADNQMLVVPDTTRDPRFADNPLVTQAPHVRFYAGALLKSREGFNLGTLCLIDLAPREFSERERGLLQKLAEIASEEMERRREEEDARGSENRLRTLVASTYDIITILAPDGTIRYESEALTRVLGYAPDDMVGHNVSEFVHPDDIGPVREALGRVVSEPRHGASAEFRYRHRDGSWRVLEAVGRNRLDDADIGGIVVNSRDVTERRETQDALRDSEEQLRLALDAGQMGVWRVDLRAQEAFWSPRFRAMHGLPPEASGGSLQQFLECVHPNDRATVDSLVPQALEARHEFRTEYRTVWPDGSVRWIESRAVPFFDGEGQPLYVLGMALDITERKAAEAELRAEAARLAALTAAQNDIAVADFDLKHVMEHIAQRIMELTRAEGVAILSVNGEAITSSAGAGIFAPHIGALTALRGSLAGQSTLDDRVLRCDDAQSDPRVDREGCRRMGVRSLLAAPLRHHERTAWVLLIASQRPNAFSERDEQTVDLLRGLCASVISRTVEEEAKRAALEALSESEKRKAAIVETALDCIVTIDHEGRVLEWNPAAEKTLGHPTQEAIGKYLHDLIIPPELRQAHRNGLDKYLQTGEGPILGQRLELPAVRADGRHITVEVAIVPIPGIEPPIFTGHLRDITERKAAEAQLRQASQRVTTILESITDAFFLLDRDWRFTHLNEQAELLMGRRRDELLGRTMWQEFPESLGTNFEREYRRCAETGQPVIFEEFYAPQGKWFEVRAYPSIEGLSVYFHDVTARRQAQADLQAAKSEADRQRAIAERANNAKSEFLSRMSHELRTPLNAILGFGQLLESADLEPEDLESAEYILKAGGHLLELINEVLDIARIESGRLSLSPEPVAVRSVCEEVLSLVRPMASNRGLTLRDESTDCALYVQADQQRLKQVLLNLLSNAIKYNRDSGGVTLFCEEAEAGRLRLCVRDEGNGLAPENLERLFTPFERLGAENRGIEGTGIGLVLSRRLAEAMGGTLEVQSTVGEGSTFWIELPLAPTPAQEEVGEAQAPSEVQPPDERAGVGALHRKVLYIEDNLSNLQLIQRLLQRRPKIELLSAMQGRLGLDLAGQHLPDLILLDLNLPEMGGDEVLRRLRANSATRDIPVVIISADATRGQIQRLLDAGAQRYLTKPFDVPEFLSTLDHLLKEKCG